MEWSCELPQLTSDYAPEQNQATGFARVCLVVVGGERFAVELEQVREVFELESITSVPGMPAALVGVANLRGTIVPVTDVRETLGASLATTPRYVMVVQHEALQVGLLIDTVPEIRTISAEDRLGLSDTDTTRGHRFLSGLIKVENRVSGMLEIAVLVASVEGAALDEPMIENR